MLLCSNLLVKNLYFFFDYRILFLCCCLVLLLEILNFGNTLSCFYILFSYVLNHSLSNIVCSPSPFPLFRFQVLLVMQCDGVLGIVVGIGFISSLVYLYLQA